MERAGDGWHPQVIKFWDVTSLTNRLSSSEPQRTDRTPQKASQRRSCHQVVCRRESGLNRLSYCEGITR
jgi:hypothetical protein